MNENFCNFLMTADEKWPTPCHIIDWDRLSENLAQAEKLRDMSGCKILLAVKGFSSPYIIEKMKGFLDGISASGLFEAIFAKKLSFEFIQTYSPAFREQDIDEIIENSNYIVFNSERQLEKYSGRAKAAGLLCGIRINPLFSSIVKEDVNPATEQSRLGINIKKIDKSLLQKVNGIHIHSMCEQHADALEVLVEFLIRELGEAIDSAGTIKWINLGGGQMIGSKNYDLARAAKAVNRLKERFDVEVIIEPCEGIVTESGYFMTTVCDIVENSIPSVIMDASPVCHMQDAIFRGWTRDVIGECAVGEKGYKYYFSGPTCFAGDSFGIYEMRNKLVEGDKLVFVDTAAYTMVKNSTFNGMPLPTLCIWSQSEGLRIVHQYDYSSYGNNI